MRFNVGSRKPNSGLKGRGSLGTEVLERPSGTDGRCWEAARPWFCLSAPPFLGHRRWSSLSLAAAPPASCLCFSQGGGMWEEVTEVVCESEKQRFSRNLLMSHGPELGHVLT